MSETNVSKRSFGKTIWLVLLSIAVLIILATVYYTLKSSPTITRESLEQEILDIQKSLPIHIDAHTELINVELVGMNIHYTYTVQTGPTEASAFNPKDKNFAQQIESAVKGNACLNSQTKRYIKSNVSLSYHYLDENNQSVASFEVPAGFCK